MTRNQHLNEYKTEIIGVSAEIAIAEVFNLEIDENYSKRANREVVDMIKPIVKGTFDYYKIPYPIKLISLNQNPIDFILEEGKTLSVKTNQKSKGNIAPQIIGQPTSKTYFKHFSNELKVRMPEFYKQRMELFKKITLDNPLLVISKYWENLFKCDYLMYFYDFLDKDNKLKQKPEAIVFDKTAPQKWVKDKFSFTKDINTWNESNTIKYDGISFGEFQVHNNRDCFKFRFKLSGILKVLSINNDK
ncbi:hypothetical protein [Mycoplasma bradburyae]|uniref:Restriction endonuclease n=1 Tax=Mycoplasma bradburyae TaxID=2963128 RepID=A0AAW6HNW4_9MOLU|nr:hypothetical protein [Mycoplasma bradburyae]MDC4183527.1 hypothetical protein [Mycoplasma bradburyae]